MDKLIFSKSEIEHSIPDRFERIVERFPFRTAVKTELCELNYAELNAWANRLAHAISLEIGSGDEPILLLFGHEIAILPTIFAVLKTGRAYVALDLEYPPDRINKTLEDLQPRMIITNSQYLHLAAQFTNTGISLLNIDHLEASLSDQNPTNNPRSPHLHEAIFYTSGTSGEPKGVARSHQFVLHRIWMESNDYDIQPTDIFSLIHHPSFGASQTDIFNALLNGAALKLFDIRKYGVTRLINWLKEEEITYFHIPTDLFRQFIDLLQDGDFFPKLRQITPSGRLYKKDVEGIRQHIPLTCTLIQRLASTETGMITRFVIDQHTELKSNVVPVGYAVVDKEIHILDQSGEPVGPNTVGEIAVTSAYLSSGYWRNPDLTRQVFVPAKDGTNRTTVLLGDFGRMRSDGCVELLGRKDARVKIRGYRVELSEIEAALLDLEVVKEAVVIPQQQESGEDRLVAYLVPAGEAIISLRDLRKALTSKLPVYMIPSLFILLEKLPLTDRNKLDLSLLPDPGKARLGIDDSFLAPHTTTEIMLAEIWSEVLAVEQLGIQENFFELGGHSLLAAQIIARVNAACQVDLPLRSLFDNPTISGFALAVENASDHRLEPDDVELQNALRMLGYS